MAANDTAKRFLARVKQLRQAQNLSQEAFAEKAGLKYKHYQAIEAGRKGDIRFSTLEKLAKACGLQAWELLNFESGLPALAEDKSATASPRRLRETHGGPARGKASQSPTNGEPTEPRNRCPHIPISNHRPSHDAQGKGPRRHR